MADEDIKTKFIPVRGNNIGNQGVTDGQFLINPKTRRAYIDSKTTSSDNVNRHMLYGDAFVGTTNTAEGLKFVTADGDTSDPIALGGTYSSTWPITIDSSQNIGLDHFNFNKHSASWYAYNKEQKTGPVHRLDITGSGNMVLLTKPVGAESFQESNEDGYRYRYVTYRDQFAWPLVVSSPASSPNSVVKLDHFTWGQRNSIWYAHADQSNINWDPTGVSDSDKQNTKIYRVAVTDYGNIRLDSKQVYVTDPDNPPQWTNSTASGSRYVVFHDQIFEGATQTANGGAGLVKQPLKADYTKFLCGNGNWESLPVASPIIINSDNKLDIYANSCPVLYPKVSGLTGATPPEDYWIMVTDRNGKLRWIPQDYCQLVYAKNQDHIITNSHFPYRVSEHNQIFIDRKNGCRRIQKYLSFEFNYGNTTSINFTNEVNGQYYMVGKDDEEHETIFARFSFTPFVPFDGAPFVTSAVFSSNAYPIQCNVTGFGTSNDGAGGERIDFVVYSPQEITEPGNFSVNFMLWGNTTTDLN